MLALPNGLIIKALQQPGNEVEKIAVARMILTHEDLLTLPNNIIVEVLRQPGNDTEKLVVVEKILPDINSSEESDKQYVLEALKFCSACKQIFPFA